MRYRNTKTGAIIDSPCTLSGGNWVTEEEFEELTAMDEDNEDLIKEDLEDDGDVIKLSEMTIAELKELAAEHEIDLGVAKKKADIIEVILASQE